MGCMQIKAVIRKLLGDKPNQTELAKQLGVSQPQISRWLRGQDPRGATRARITALAVKRRIISRAEDVEESPVSVIGFVGAGGEIIYNEGQGPFDEAPMPPDGPDGPIVAVVVRGSSMAPQIKDGWTVYYQNVQRPPTDDLYGKPCVIGLPDGRVLIKELQPGRGRGLFDLYSVNGDLERDQPVSWAAKVEYIKPR
jgi:transcriptional regulator with XRE-family HTH domain